jgi:site-specific DNA recombinase
MGRAKPQVKSSETKIRCAIYTRKSTEDGLDQEFNSLDAQREAAEAYIASQKHEGWVCLPTLYDDGGFSGGNVERPGLQRMLADIRDGRIDCVVVYKVDRLSRSLMDFARVMETFEKHNVSFVSVTQQFNTTHSMGRLTLNILLSFAQFEREIIGERIRDKLAAQRRKGKWAGGIPVLGYDVDRSNRSPKLVVNVKEAAQVRKIFEWYLELGSLLPVVQRLAEKGMNNKSWTTKRDVPRGGRPFDKNALYSLLTNPIYIGLVVHKGERFAGEHPAIIDETVFLQVQSTLRLNGRTGGKDVRNKYGALLRGLLRCKSCDRMMTHTFTQRKEKLYRYYTCGSANSAGHQECPQPTLPAAEIEEAVIEQIRSIGLDRSLQAEVLRQTEAGIAEEREILTAEREQFCRDRVFQESELRRFAMEPSSPAVATMIADLHEKIAKTKVRLAELDEQLEDLESEHIAETDVTRAFGDFDQLWRTLSSRQQAKLISLIVERVEYDAGRGTMAICFHDTAIGTLTERHAKEKS